MVDQFLGGLLRVDLIKPGSMSVHPSIRTYVRNGLYCAGVPLSNYSLTHTYIRTYIYTSVRPQKVSPIRMKFGVYVEVDE